MSDHDPRFMTARHCMRKTANDTVRHATGNWEIWNCEGPDYRHDYDRDVSLLVNTGKAIVSFSDGLQVDLQPGDLMTIFSGVSASWSILDPIQNLYIYHDQLPTDAKRPSEL